MDLMTHTERAELAAMQAKRTEAYRMQPRINLRRDVGSSAVADTAVNPTLPSFTHRLFGRKECQTTSTSDTCEKPVGTSMTVYVVLAVVLPIIIIACFLLYLHRRNVKRQRMEDVQDPHKSLDFGLAGGAGKPKRKSMFLGITGEKGMSHKPGQLSMDMNLESPYLLPPGMQQSRESLNSLARSLANDTQDPYQMVHTYTQSDTGSIRSLNQNKETSSVYTRSSSKYMSGATGRSIPHGRMPPPRSNSLHNRSPDSPAAGATFNIPAMPQPAHKPSPSDDEKHDYHARAVVPEIGLASDYDEKRDPDTPQPPPQARTKSPEFQLPSIAQPNSAHDGTSTADDFPLPPHRGRESTTGLGLNFHLPKVMSPTTHDGPRSAPINKEEDVYDAYPAAAAYDDYDDDNRGRTMARQSYVEDQPPQQQGLGVPQTQNKRLSVGFRPLPPDEVTESEDPEYRANRIRSFYKEYFDDSRDPAPPVPPVPGYYEDYDPGFLPDAAAYFDPDSNAFVMPYAENITRRAMTPPPAGRRPMPGPPRRGPGAPHGPHGSLGGMSLPGGPRGRPRAGSAFGPRTGSAFSPRPGSSASARSRGPKKALPPPAPLSTLPTPSKLRDDSYAMMSAIDFAPPDRIRDNAAGRRAASPFGERRAYSPAVPVASPLVTAFDDLAALPSPHLLRKSSTFTGLDFAPPKKFHESGDTMSDSGSIRSNKSGLSAAQRGALRAGAGRVSRLPGDTVFTSTALQDTLKPQWGMRNGM